MNCKIERREGLSFLYWEKKVFYFNFGRKKNFIENKLCQHERGERDFEKKFKRIEPEHWTYQRVFKKVTEIFRIMMELLEVWCRLF